MSGKFSILHNKGHSHFYRSPTVLSFG